MKKFIIIFFFFPFFLSAQIDTTTASLVNWMTIEQADKEFQKVQKPFLIDVYTDWCSWCKHMLKTTYSNPNIAAYINTNFYPVQINAETRDTLTFRGKKYESVLVGQRRGKDVYNNTLASALLNNKMSYPTTVFISRDSKLTLPVPSYMNTSQIEPILVYFVEDLHRFIEPNQYRIAHMFAYPKAFSDEIKALKPEEKPDTNGNPNWLSINDAIEKSKTTPKKFILFSNYSNCHSCNVMKKVTFSDSVISSTINENFYLSEFDVFTSETIYANGKEYKSMGERQPNAFAMEIFKGQFSFPSVVFFDDNFSQIGIISGYMNAKSLEPLIHFILEDKYQTEKYEDYLKTFKSQIK